MSDPARWLQIKELFRQSQQQPEHERERWLADQCADDSDMLRQLGGLLAAQRASPGILDDGAVGVLRQLGNDQAARDLSEQHIGAYRLLRLLGEGGMGSVYLAERDDGSFVQRVALKLVRADFVNAETRARFFRERNFHARLVHPHIAQLHDGGVTADGTPYFTLEYIEGEPITKYCDTHALDIRQRLLLILQVCAAVEYAHRNLIVHRDLKPTNILIGGDGTAKLLDFGIAKLLDVQPGEEQTVTQARMMTPQYASPEQVLGEPITTATDVYAIGVLLYELLCGRLPYARADSGTISWAKAVVEEAPESLGRALSRTAGSAKRPTGDAAAATRNTTLPALRRSLRGDLDRIAHRALAKEPEARYASVNALADDVRAYVAGRAISGGSRRYRLRKFVRRHWLPLAAAATIALVLVSSVAAIVWQARQTAHQAQATLAVRDFLYGLFTAVDPREAKGREVSAHELLDRGAERITRNKTLDAQQKGEMSGVLGRIYYQLGLFDQAEKLQESAIASLSALNEQPLLIARLESERAETMTERADLKGAAALVNAAQKKIDSVANAPIVDRARVLHAKAMISIAQRDFLSAQRNADAELALVRNADVDNNVLFHALLSAGTARWGLTKTQEAETLFREALAVALRDAGQDDLDVAQARANIGNALQNESRYAEAAGMAKQAWTTRQKVLGPNHPKTMDSQRSLGLSYFHLGLYAQARVELEQVIAAQRANLGNEHPAVAGTQINLGLTLTELRDMDAAERVLNESISIFEKKYGRDYDGVHIALGNLAALHLVQGKLDLAENELTEVRIQDNKKPPGMDAYFTGYRMGELKRLRGNAKGAIAEDRAALELAEKLNGDDNRYAALAHHYLGLALRDGGDEAAAEKQMRAALVSYAGYIPKAEHPLAATTRYELGLMLTKHDDTRAEGIRLLTDAVSLREKFLGIDEPRTQQARAALLKAKDLAKN